MVFLKFYVARVLKKTITILNEKLLKIMKNYY